MTRERAKFVIDEFEILDFLKELKRIKSKIWMWQSVPASEGGGRRVHLGIVKNVNFERKTLDVQPMTGSKFKFVKSDELYLYLQKRQIGFRSRVKEIDSGFVDVYFPKKLNLLTGHEFTDFKIVEDDNAEKFTHLRQAPRKAAGANQYIEILRNFGPHRGEQSVYRLHDISSGGMGIITLDPGDFIKGEQVEVISINGKQAVSKLRGEVVAVRKLDGDADLFKVGFKFF